MLIKYIFFCIDNCQPRITHESLSAYFQWVSFTNNSWEDSYKRNNIIPAKVLPICSLVSEEKIEMLTGDGELWLKLT